jgi:hypothetical protein
MVRYLGKQKSLSKAKINDFGKMAGYTDKDIHRFYL